MPDVQVANHGSLFLFDLLTEGAREWAEIHIPEDATWWAGQLVIEPRYAGDVARGMLGDGLKVV